jgi:hypothetical protein
VAQAPDLSKQEALLSRLSLHIRRIVTTDTEISTSVCGFSLRVDGVCWPSRDDRTSRKEFGIQFQGHPSIVRVTRERERERERERAPRLCPMLQWAQHNEEPVHTCCKHITIMSARCSNVCNIVRCRPELLFVAESTAIAQHSSVVLATRSVGYASWDPDSPKRFVAGGYANAQPQKKTVCLCLCNLVWMFYMSVKALNLLATEERCWALLYSLLCTPTCLPVNVYLRPLLNVPVQIANKMGFQKKKKEKNMSVEYLCLGRIWINAPIVVQLDLNLLVWDFQASLLNSDSVCRRMNTMDNLLSPFIPDIVSLTPYQIYWFSYYILIYLLTCLCSARQRPLSKRQ